MHRATVDMASGNIGGKRLGALMSGSGCAGPGRTVKKKGAEATTASKVNERNQQGSWPATAGCLISMHQARWPEAPVSDT